MPVQKRAVSTDAGLLHDALIISNLLFLDIVRIRVDLQLQAFKVQRFLLRILQLNAA